MEFQRRVIVADDLADNVGCIALLLRDAGCDVLELTDPTHLVSRAIDFRPHAVLLDVRMKGASGCDIARALRRHPPLSAVLIAAVTGWVDDASRRDAADAGIDYFFAKPADPQALIDLVLSVERSVERRSVERRSVGRNRQRRPELTRWQS